MTGATLTLLALALVTRLPKIMEQARLWDEMRRRDRRLINRARR